MGCYTGICRTDEENTEKYISEVSDRWLRQINLPASDVEEEFAI